MDLLFIVVLLIVVFICCISCPLIDTLIKEDRKFGLELLIPLFIIYGAIGVFVFILHPSIIYHDPTGFKAWLIYLALQPLFPEQGATIIILLGDILSSTCPDVYPFYLSILLFQRGSSLEAITIPFLKGVIPYFFNYASTVEIARLFYLGILGILSFITAGYLIWALDEHLRAHLEIQRVRRERKEREKKREQVRKEIKREIATREERLKEIREKIQEKLQEIQKISEPTKDTCPYCGEILKKTPSEFCPNCGAYIGDIFSTSPKYPK